MPKLDEAIARVAAWDPSSTPEDLRNAVVDALGEMRDILRKAA